MATDAAAVSGVWSGARVVFGAIMNRDKIVEKIEVVFRIGFTLAAVLE